MSSTDAFIKSNTTKVGLRSSSHRSAPKKSKGGNGTSADGGQDLNPEGTPRMRKNPHRSARAPLDGTAASFPPEIPTQETLAAAEKPPEQITEAEKRVRRKQELREEERKREARRERKELKRLEKEETRKRRELESLEDRAAEARQAEEMEAARMAEEIKQEAKAIKEERRIARLESRKKKEEEDRKVAAAKEKKDKVQREKEEEKRESELNKEINKKAEKRLAEKKRVAEQRRIVREKEKLDKKSQMDNNSKENDETGATDNDERSEATADDLNDTEDEEEEVDTEDEEDNMEEDEDDEENNGYRQSYSEAAGTGNDDDTASVNNVRWKYRRVRITIKIETPKDKETRLIGLQEKANKILELGRRSEPNLYLRKFEETGIPKDDEKGTWIHKFSLTDLSATHFCDHLAHGLSNWIPLDRQSFYFRATFVAPETCRFAKVLEEISHFIPESCKVSNLLSQLIFDPVKLGNLLRSNEKMTSTDGFLDELNRRAKQLNPNVAFGMSYSEMRRPNGERAKDWKKATRAVQLETNASCMREATDIALRLFPGKRMRGHKPVWGMNLVFVYDIGHEDVEQLDTALQNIDVLVSRQKMHMKYENRCSTNKILPGVMDDAVYQQESDTFREVLMSITSKTTEGCEGGKIFSSVMFSDYKNKREFWFSYHRKVKKEAEAIVRALPVMLKVEYGLVVENLFFETAIDPNDQWNPVTRSLRNAITRATDGMLEGTDDLHGDDMSDAELEIIEESENISLNTAESRERQRMMGENEEETVVNQTKRRKAKARTARRQTQQIEVEEIDQNADDATVSTLGDGTADFSTDTKKQKFSRELQRGVMMETSELVKESAKKADQRTRDIQHSLDEERKRSDALAQQIAAMQQLMTQAGLIKKQQDGQSLTSKNSSQQSTGQPSQQADPSHLENTKESSKFETPLRSNGGNRYDALSSQFKGDNEGSDSPSEHSGSGYEQGSNESGRYTYETQQDGSLKASEIPFEAGTGDSKKSSDDSEEEDEDYSDDDKSRLSHHSQDNASHQSYDDEDDDDQSSQASNQSDDSTSMMASVKSASSKLGRKIMSSLRSEATGGNPGGQD